MNWSWLSSISQAWDVALYVVAATYLWTALCLFITAKKIDTPDTWFAWIPILNLILMCRVAGRPSWWAVLLFIPLVNIVVYLDIWMTIADARGHPSWLGIFMIVPVANLVILGILAFTPEL